MTPLRPVCFCVMLSTILKKKSVIILQMVKPDRPINQWLHYNLSIETLVNELNFLFFF